jgi:hypothetical protein
MSDPLIESILDNYTSTIGGEVAERLRIEPMTPALLRDAINEIEVARAVAAKNILRVAVLERELKESGERNLAMINRYNDVLERLHEYEDEADEEGEDYTAEDIARDNAVRLADWKSEFRR